MLATRLIAGLLATVGAGAVSGQNIGMMPPPQNVLQLSASATVEVRQDLLTMVLSTTREGPEPAALQTELKTALDAALAEARKNAEPGQLDVHTGNFGLYPRQGKDGRITSWQGRAELVLEGRDFARISAAAGRIQSLGVSRADFGLSREQRARVEDEAQQKAIENFRSRGEQIARGFGFGGYTLREVTVNSNEPYPQPQFKMRSMAAPAAMAADGAVPVEAGNSTVTVTVQGSVQLK